MSERIASCLVRFTCNNLHSVSSDAVANALSNKANKNQGVLFINIKPKDLNTKSNLSNLVNNYYSQGYRFIVFSVTWDEYASYSHAGALGYILIGTQSAKAFAKLRDYAQDNYNYACRWTDYITESRCSGWYSL